MTLVKKNLYFEVSEVECAYDNVVISKFSCGKMDLILICVYIPPRDSPYYKDKTVTCNIVLLEDELVRLQELFPFAPFLICGDFNARTGAWNVHCDSDGDQAEDWDPENCSCPKQTGNRQSQDSKTNAFGQTLIGLCQVYHLCILNGSAPGDPSGRFTFLSQHGESVIDYCLLYTNDSHLSVNFRVGEQIYSNHMPLEFGIGAKLYHHNWCKLPGKKITQFRWDSEKVDIVKNNVETPEFKADINRARQLLTSDIDGALDCLMETMLSNAECMHRTVRLGSALPKNSSKWFDIECRNAKHNAREALRTYRTSRTIRDKENYVQTRNKYKQIIKTKKTEYYKLSCQTILNNVNNPCKFWQSVRYASCVGRKQINIPLEDWQIHFQGLLGQTGCVDHLLEDGSHNVNDELDAPIRDEEVRLALAKLGLKKSPGIDNIPGDYLKLLSGCITPFLTDLFNTLFEKQYFPPSWKESIIIPIHKSGDTANPKNYRGISLLSTLSKVFMSILTNRLRYWAETESKFGFEQAGFRADHSTVDHIFTLYAMAAKCVYGGGRGKLYAAFVDYQKAFDSVNRACLWSVLGKLGLSTKFVNMLKSVYAEVTARVRWNGALSERIDCTVGVRQGAVESPIIFCLFISCVADYVNMKGLHGIQLLPGTKEIFSLLFADDIVLLSTTPAGLQRQLNSLSDVSTRLGLTVNLAKTKIIVFRKGGFLGRGERWFLKDTPIEVVNRYKYLGFPFTTKLSVSSALFDQSVKAKQKIVQLLKTMWNLHTMSPKIFFKMFDAQVQPVLLYGSELWGVTRRPNVEAVHLFACKRFLGVDTRSPNSMCYGELGRYPLFVNSTVRAVKYWLRLCRLPESRLPKQAYLMLSNVNLPEEKDWAKSIENTLSRNGFAYVWQSGGSVNEKTFLRSLKQRLRDIFQQEWCEILHSSTRYTLYRSFKSLLHCEAYLSDINIKKFRDAFIRFRLGCNGLRVNVRSRDKSSDDMMCPFCDEEESETHFLLKCHVYGDLRTKYISKYLSKGGHTSVSNLMAGHAIRKTRDVAMFVFYALKRRTDEMLRSDHA